MSNQQTTSSVTGAAHGSRIVGVLGAIDGGIAWFERVILAYGIILMALNAVVNVIGRTLLGQSLYFSEELNQFLIVLITFMGMGYAARKGRHIRMSAIYDQLGETGRKLLMIIMCAVTAAVMFLLAYYAYGYVARIFRLGKVTPALQVPLYLTYIWVPIGFVITGIQYLLTIIRNLTHREVYVSYEQIDTYDDAEPTGTDPAGGKSEP
jgi:TRAP-type C4-dicarboxylate transport system permease small subunit